MALSSRESCCPSRLLTGRVYTVSVSISTDVQTVRMSTAPQPRSRTPVPVVAPVRRRRPSRQTTERVDTYIARLGDTLVEVYRSMPESEFGGVGLLVCRDAATLPRWPLTGAERPLPDGDVVAAICNSSMLSRPHDGFHILSPDWTLTHTNQYIAPPVPPDFELVGGRPGFGARHLSALLASRLPTVICAGVLNTAKRILVFADGLLGAELAP